LVEDDLFVDAPDRYHEGWHAGSLLRAKAEHLEFGRIRGGPVASKLDEAVRDARLYSEHVPVVFGQVAFWHS
jgi:hypothetical protein